MEARREQERADGRAGEASPARGWLGRLAHGAVVGLRAEAARPSLGGDRAGGLTRLTEAALVGALYASASELLQLPPLEQQLQAGPPKDRGASALAPARPKQPRRRGRPRPAAPRPIRRARTQLDSEGATPVRAAASSRLALGAAALSFSVVADSAMEHYRGGFYNPAMYVAPTVSGLTLAASARDAVRPTRRRPRRLLYGAAALTGLIGTGFHLYNISRREGGWRWVNVFYGAPLAAPLGITFAGLFGLAAASVMAGARSDTPPRLLGRPAGAVLGLAAAAGLVGTAAEAGLLHFRGAFQDPFMYVPVTVPPLAAIALGAAALRPDGSARAVARSLLWASAGAGLIGMGFHAWGIHRNMGGWRNWTQMIQQGPPLPAPPSFTGMALAGLAALQLMEEDAHVGA